MNYAEMGKLVKPHPKFKRYIHACKMHASTHYFKNLFDSVSLEYRSDTPWWLLSCNDRRNNPNPFRLLVNCDSILEAAPEVLPLHFIHEFIHILNNDSIITPLEKGLGNIYKGYIEIISALAIKKNTKSLNKLYQQFLKVSASIKTKNEIETDKITYAVLSEKERYMFVSDRIRLLTFYDKKGISPNGYDYSTAIGNYYSGLL